MDYRALRETVSEVLGPPLGQVVTLRRVVLAYDTSTREATPSQTDYSANAARLSDVTREASGVKQRCARFMLDAVNVPTPGPERPAENTTWSLVAGGQTYHIVQAMPLAPAGTTVYLDLRVKL